MQASEVIELFIDDTVRLLPRRERNDVAAELRSLLSEELQARAQQSQRPADASLAVALVRDYGHPTQVAARYRTPWAIIDPADSWNFMRAAIIGGGVLLVLSVLNDLRPSPHGTAERFVQISLFTWLGLLVVGFGLKSWIHRQFPGALPWKPHDRDRVSLAGAAVVVPIGTLVTIFYAAPGWVLELITGGRLDASWAAYTDHFQRVGLPLFVGLMGGLLAMLLFAGIRGRWSRLTRRINIGLNLALAGLILGLALTGNIFESSQVDQIARDVLGLVAVIYVSSVGVQLYGEMGRIERAGAAHEGHMTLSRAARQ